MKKSASILIVGHNDIIEKSLTNSLRQKGFERVDSSSEMALNPTIQASVYDYFQNHRPEYVFLASTRSGGIQANKDNPGEFIYYNLESQNNILYAARKFETKKLLFFGSSCIYPKDTPQPIKEDSLLTGPLEETSEAYATAKIAGVKLCQAYRKQYGFNAIVAVPATLYGPNQDMDEDKAHVLGALLGKFKKAVHKQEDEVTVWGSGTPRREFIYEDDFAQASLFLMERYDQTDIINIGTGEDIAIKELAQLIAEKVGFKGKLVFDESKPDGVKQKLLDNSRISRMGWKPATDFEKGIERCLT